jgi:murein L,D-transpeptidase YcbB/YkuD
MPLSRLFIIGILIHSITVSAIANDSIRIVMDTWSAGYDKIIFEAKIHHSTQISNFYEETNYQPIWIESSTLTNNGQKLIEAIMLVSDEGLNPADYKINRFNHLKTSTMINTEFDILLSDAFLLLSSHLLNGKVIPASLSDEWIAKEKPFDAKSLLYQIKNNQAVDDILNSLKPKKATYHKLKKSLSKLTKWPQPKWDYLELKPAIKLNMTDARIPTIRKILLFWEDYKSEDETAIYDKNLVEAVKKFQIHHGLEADGIIGKQTIQVLNLSIDDYIKKIVVNLERLRWQNNYISDNRIEVNIAEFYLRVYINKQLAMEKPVIVGKNYRKTPVFDDELKYLVFNPTWTVPQRLINEDKLPEIIKDPTYLEKMEFKLYQIGTNIEVDPKLVDWSAVTKKNFPFRMVQSPGDKNALGHVKFMFPNSFDVYLHDTPTRDLFNKSDRAFSSGCIRVKDPIDLAELLLKSQSIETSQINTILKSKETKTIYLTKPIPISLEYWTAWVDESDNLIIRTDIYQRDDALYKALINPINNTQ